MGFDMDSGRHIIDKPYCLYVVQDNCYSDKPDIVFHFQKRNGDTFGGKSIDALAKECAQRMYNSGSEVPAADNVGTINSILLEPLLADTACLPFLPEEIAAFLKSYSAYAEKFQKEGLPEIDCIRRAPGF
jgi:hypothetical protein